MIWLRFVVSEGITSVVLGTLTTSSVNRNKRTSDVGHRSVLYSSLSPEHAGNSNLRLRSDTTQLENP